MNIMAVDSSGTPASVAIIHNGRLLYEETMDTGLTHSQTLAPMMEHAFASTALRPDDMDYFAAAVGPGSFTGLRIGVAAMQGLAHACGKKTVPVNTLEALAYHIAGEQRVCPMLDARNGNVYAAVSQTGRAMNPIHENYAGSIDAFLALLAKTGSYIFLGDGAETYSAEISAQLGERALFAPAHLMRQRASCVAAAAMAKICRGEAVEYSLLQPFYIKKPQAEEQYDKRNAK
jgi:tRNA threonylcarbamoyladenosine biosynthesis protein TsaB